MTETLTRPPATESTAPSEIATPVVRDYDRLVDGRFGLVTTLHRKVNEPDEPRGLVSFHGRVGDARQFGEWYADRISLGTAFHDEIQAKRAAIGEAVERYCGNYIPWDRLVDATWNELHARGERAIDPDALPLYSERQYATRGFPFRRLERDSRIYWAPGRDLLDGSDAWVPASLVYPNFLNSARVRDLPKHHFVNLSGLAAGIDREDAERSALEEMIERDAVTVWWISGSPCRPLDPASDPSVRAAMLPGDLDDPRPLTYQFTEIPNIFGIPVVATLLRDPKHDIVTLGVACRCDAAGAAQKALAEAVHLRSYSREMLEPDGRIWKMMDEGVLDPRVYKRYRRDRHYLDDYRDDFRDVVDLGCHAQIYLDPRFREPLSRFDGEWATRPLSDVRAPSAAERRDPRRLFLDRLGAEGLGVYSVDCTTSDVAATGLATVRVVVTGMVGNAPAAFPMLGPRRLFDDPVRLGLLDEAPREEDLVAAPLPHT